MVFLEQLIYQPLFFLGPFYPEGEEREFRFHTQSGDQGSRDFLRTQVSQESQVCWRSQKNQRDQRSSLRILIGAENEQAG